MCDVGCGRVIVRVSDALFVLVDSDSVDQGSDFGTEGRDAGPKDLAAHVQMIGAACL